MERLTNVIHDDRGRVTWVEVTGLTRRFISMRRVQSIESLTRQDGEYTVLWLSEGNHDTLEVPYAEFVGKVLGVRLGRED